MANILAVDDNIELCKLIRTALERDGHRVEKMCIRDRSWDAFN